MQMKATTNPDLSEHAHHDRATWLSCSVSVRIECQWSSSASEFGVPEGIKPSVHALVRGGASAMVDCR